MITNYQCSALLSDSANKHANSFIFSVRKLLNLPFIVLLITQFFSPALRAQQQAALLFENATQQGVQEALYKNNITKTANNFIYTTGASLNASGNYDIIVTKHNNANVEQWTQTWSNTAYDGLDMAADLTIDSNGDIIVVGTTQLALTNYDAVVLKYSSAGTLLWSQTFNGSVSGPDGFVTVLASGTDIYCGGSVLNNVLQQHDALAVKYNGSGTQQWSHIYNTSNNLRDGHNRIAMNGGNVLFYGGVQTAANPITWTMVRLELNGSTGAQVSANLSNNASATFTQITDIDIDAQDNIYVTGHVNTAQGKDLKVVKLVSMAVSWTFTYNGPANLDDEANCIDVSGSFVYVAGYTTTASTGKDLYAVKIPLAGPPVSWQKIIDQDGGDDTFTALNLDAAGQLYLAGSVYRVSNLDLCVYKLNFSTGAITAHNTYNNDYNGNDFATGVAIDEEGNVFVAGQSQVTTDSYKYNLTKWSQKTVYMPVVPHSSSGGYLSNVSQLRNDDGSANVSVLYYNQQNRVATYLNDSTMMFQLIQASDSTNVDTTYRVDMRFTKGNTNQKLYAWDVRKEYTNFYLSHMTRKGERTPSYNGLWKSSVYTNTDLLYNNGPSGCKQYIIARSGAPTGDFEMSFDGQTSLSIAANGNLIIATSIGQIEYAKPKAYSMNLSTGVMTLHNWQPSYAISSNKVSFTGIGSWGGALVLEVGEPSVSSSSQVLENVDWSTMFGGQGDESFRDVKANASGDAFAVGAAQFTSFILNVGETIGAYSGDDDAILVKFDTQCKAIFLSFYGGENNDSFESIDLMSNTNDVHVIGNTFSSDLANATNITMEDPTLGGDRDGLYLKFNANGFLLFHTYVGGDGVDALIDIAVDYVEPFDTKLIYYIGGTYSDQGWPQFENEAPNQSMGYSGSQDGFYIKRMGSNEEIVHQTFFGSEGYDVFQSIALYKGSPLILGTTSTTTYSPQENVLPNDGLFPKAHGPFEGSDFISNNNTEDANYFIVHFGNIQNTPGQFNDQLKWCTYIAPAPTLIFSPNSFQQHGDITTHFDNYNPISPGSVYVAGLMQIPSDLNDLDFELVPNGWHQSTAGGDNEDSFIMKWRMENNAALLVSSTLFGADGHDEITAIDTDENGNFYITGYSQINTIASQSEWCEPPTDQSFPMCDHNGQLYTETEIFNSGSRAFVAAFNAGGQMHWSTQYGSGTGNAARGICTNETKVWIVGSSNKDWTFEEYNDNSEFDYFREIIDPSNLLPEATIARFDIPQIVGVNETLSSLDHQHHIIIYPNPSSNQIAVDFSAMEYNGPIEIRMLNSSGQMVKSEQLITTSGVIHCELFDMASGLYHLVLVGEGLFETANFIKH